MNNLNNYKKNELITMYLKLLKDSGEKLELRLMEELSIYNFKGIHFETKGHNPDTLKSYSKDELILMYIKLLLESKKVITPKLKALLLDYGFNQIVIGTKEEHKITSKVIKENFYGNDIAIGLAPISISYNSGRRYIALVFNFNKH